MLPCRPPPCGPTQTQSRRPGLPQSKDHTSPTLPQPPYSPQPYLSTKAPASFYEKSSCCVLGFLFSCGKVQVTFTILTIFRLTVQLLCISRILFILQN